MIQASRHYALLDYARGLAALGVVFHHRGVHPKFPTPLNWFSEYGLLGVSIFFVISGFVIYQASERYQGGGAKGPLRFAWKRIKRIYPAYWASLALCLLVAYSPLMNYDLIPEATYHWNLFPPPYGIGDVLSSAVLYYNVPPLHFFAPNVVYWTLEVEQQFYILIGLILLPFVVKARSWVIIALTPIALLTALDLFGLRSLSFYALPRHWIAFELGILVYFIIAKPISRRVSLPIFGLLVAAGLIGSFSDGVLVDNRTFAASLAAVAILLFYPLNKMLSGKAWLMPLRFLGTISYSLYLIHLPAFTINDWLFAGVMRVGSLSGYFSGILMAIALAFVFYLIFERPFVSAGQRMIFPRPRQDALPMPEAAQVPATPIPQG